MCPHSSKQILVSHGFIGCRQAFIHRGLVIQIQPLSVGLKCCFHFEMSLPPLLCSLTFPPFRYTQNGILHMLDRNKRIKSKPERFQNCKDKFDLVITCEERVYDQVVEGEPSHDCFNSEGSAANCRHIKSNLYQTVILLTSNLVVHFFFCCCSPDLNSREQETLQPVHVINVDIQDNHEEATLGAFLICELCQCVSVSYRGVLNSVVQAQRWQALI